MMRRPNIPFIMADDLGHWSLGCEGNPDAITPHIDSLAAEGMQLRRFYCASPVCSPARQFADRADALLARGGGLDPRGQCDRRGRHRLPVFARPKRLYGLFE